MTAGIFADCVFFLKLNNLSFKEKKHLKRSISSHGGSFSFVLNDKCTHVIASNASSLGSTHLKKIHKHHISLVNLEFIWKCIEEKQLLKEASDFEKPVDVILEKVKSVERKEASRYVRSMKNLRPVTNLPDTRDDIFDREYTVEEMKEVEPTSSEDTEVAKYCFLQKDREVAVLELLCHKENHSFPFKISTSSGPLDGLQKEHSFYLAKDSEKACERYAWRINDLKNKGFLQKDDAPSQAIPFASDALQKVLLEETINTGTISREVGYFVESIWTDAQGHLSNILSCPVNNISINDVGVAEGILLQMKTSLAAQESARQMGVMMCEFYRLIPHITVSTQEITMELLTKKQELCQLIRDMLNVCETTPSSRYPSSLAKYRALRCRIELLDKNAEEFVRVSKQILQKNYSNEPIEILNIYQIGRLSETCDFDGKLENVQPLLHATSPRNFVGILSRGLLMPKIITEEMGYNRTDVGNLGSGIYFTDSISTSVKYSESSSTSGSRLLVVCDVALGKSRKVHKKDYTITEPPEGFHSVHGVRRAPGIESDFEDNEFVVYKRNQIKMAYAVQFRTSRDIPVNLPPNVLSVELEETPDDSVEGLNPLDGSVIDDMCNENNIKGGLQNTQGEQIPLEKIYVKAKVTDLVAQVILFQIYKNSSANPIEAKYVFPLDSTAAVCGFEAFINGKHIVGEVKEKQQARQEYRSAIKEGHGAYLMDQDAPDAFTVSVGNLPPKATVIIKITYLMEMELDFGDACNFKIPGAVASWKKDTAIKENTQDTVTKVGVDQDGVPEGCFSLQMSIELPYKIDRIQCHTHKILTKKTDCKAVIQTTEGSSLSDAGFQLLIAMENPYVPRMWVEKHPEKDSEACMLVFQPEFPNTCEAGDVTICLDCSNSMKPCFQNAQLLALYLASSVFSGDERNVVLFGSSYKEFDFYPRSNLRKTEELEKFIKMAKPNMGGTEFWKPLHSLGLLPRNTGLHNIILISDGHLQNERHTIQFLKKNMGKIRLFTCGVGATANRHSLRRLALLGNGTFDFFDAKTKSKWKDQMQSLHIKLFNNGCTGVTVKWTRHNRPDEEPSQAPAKLPPIFSHGRLIVYGFIRHCTQATLKALIEDKEMETMVSTTELQKTTGTMLHKLTARALIRDYEDGILHEEEDENEMQKQLRKSEIINLSKEYSIVTQFTSFIAVEKRDADEQQDVEPNILEIISSEDVDFLPYMDWQSDVAFTSSSGKIMDYIVVDDSEDFAEEEDDYFVCDDPLPISPQEDLKAPLHSSFLKRKSRKTILIRTPNDEEDAPVYSQCSSHRLPAAPAGPVRFSSSIGAILGPKPFEQTIHREKKSSETLDSDLAFFRPQPLCGQIRPISLVCKPEVQLFGASTSRNLSASFQSSAPPQRDGAVLFGSSVGGLSRETGLQQERTFSLKSDFSSSMPSPLSFIQEKPSGGPPRAALKFKAYQSDILQKDQILPQMEPLSLVDQHYGNRSSRGRRSVYDTQILAQVDSVESFRSSSPPFIIKYDHNVHRVKEKAQIKFGGTASLEETSQPPSSQIHSAPGVSMQGAAQIPGSFGSAAPSSAYFRPFAQPATGGAGLFGSSTINFSIATTSQPPSTTSMPPLFRKVMSPRDQPSADVKVPQFGASFGSAAPSSAFFRPFAQPATGGGALFGSPAIDFSSAATSQPPSTTSMPPLFRKGMSARDQPSADVKVPQFGASFGSAAPSSAVFQPFAQPATGGGALFGSSAFGFSSASSSQQPDSLFPDMLLAKSVPYKPLMSLLKKKSVGRQPDADVTEGGSSPKPKHFFDCKLEMPAVKRTPLSWADLSVLQTKEGFWMLTPELGKILAINVPFLIDDFLMKKGIVSLGSRGKDDVCGLIATLLVLQAIRLLNLVNSINFKSLLKLDESSCTSEYCQNIENAIKWARKVEQQYPGICVRLGLGKDWDFVTKQLLRFEPMEWSSELRPALDIINHTTYLITGTGENTSYKP